MKYLYAFCALAILYSPSAFAHVTANPNNGNAGAYFQTSFRISHGCDGSDTTEIRIQIPAGFASVRTQAKPGWTTNVKKRKLDRPIPAGHGRMSDEEVTEVSWSGGHLPDSQYDEFGILLKLPETPETKLWFPVVQKCAKGENRWTEIPSGDQEWHDLKSPAPFVDVTGDAPPHKHAH